MTIVVVEVLEKVDIEENQGNRRLGAGGAQPLLVEHDLEVAAVAQVGQGVRYREPAQLESGFLELPVLILKQVGVEKVAAQVILHQ